MESIEVIFQKIKAGYDERQSGLDGLVCKQGAYYHSYVLKLQKASWTNDRMDNVRNKSGIFFCVWVDDDAAKRERVHYNIHALKLRELKGYSITSRAFAEDFRGRFAALAAAWPNVSVAYGPLTLMQGWIEFVPETFEADVVGLMERFGELSPLIDGLLEARRRRQGRGLKGSVSRILE